MPYTKRGIKVQQLPKSERPREKLVAVGVENLASAELIALILGSGTKKHNVLNVASSILKKFSLHELGQSDISDLSSVDGVGEVQAGKILASLELGRRAHERLSSAKLLHPSDAVSEVEEIRAKSREYLVALYLNARHELIKKETLTIGGLNSNMIEPRDVFVEAVRLPCAYFILCHNHPSGDATPSQDDKQMTKTLVQAGKLLGISLIDHIIVTKENYFSFREGELL